jgi:hypothetical protein
MTSNMCIRRYYAPVAMWLGTVSITRFGTKFIGVSFPLTLRKESLQAPVSVIPIQAVNPKVRTPALHWVIRRLNVHHGAV